MSAHAKAATVGLILAGGEGSRLGGVFKAGIRLDNTPLLELLRQSLAPQVDHIVYASGPYPAHRFPDVGKADLLPDPPGGFGGPAVAISTAVAHLAQAESSPEFLVTVPGDTPGLPKDFVDRLRETQQKTGADAVMAAYAGQIHPIHALWRLDALLARSRTAPPPWTDERVRYLLDNRVACDFDDNHRCDPFLGINRVADLLEWEHRRADGNLCTAPQTRQAV